MHVVYCLAYICIYCRTADVLVDIDLTLSLSPCYVQLLRNAGVNSIFFHPVWPAYFCYADATRIKSGKNPMETGFAVTRISYPPFSPLISIPELRDTRFSYSNLRLRSLKLVQETIPFCHRFILARPHYTYSICFR